MLTGKPTGMRHLGRSWRKWEDNIRMELKIGVIRGTGMIWLRICIIGEPL